jgi:hypothetical protein
MARSRKRRKPPPAVRAGTGSSSRPNVSWRSVGAFVAAAVLTAVTGWISGATNSAVGAVVGLFQDDSPLTTTGRRIDPAPAPSVAGSSASGPTVGTSSPASSAGPSVFAWRGSAEGFHECGRGRNGLIVAREPAQIRPPRSQEDNYEAAADWMDEYQAADRETTNYEFVVQAKAGRTATLTAARAEYVKRRPPASTATVVILDYEECGGVETPRIFSIDLDSPTGRFIPAGDKPTTFPYTVRNDDPEVFRVAATTTSCDCFWRIAVFWSADGQTGVIHINDENGREFHTAPDRATPQLAWSCFGDKGCWEPVKANR